MTTEADEPPREPTGTTFTDAVTYAWGDADAQRFGHARVELTPGATLTAAQASGHALLFAGRAPVAVRAAAALPAERSGGWDAIDVAGIRTREHAPLQSWDVLFTGDDGCSGFALRFVALSPPATLPADAASAVDAGLQGYSQLCRVTGIATIAGEPCAIDCLGERGHAWGAPEHKRIALVRSVSAWLDDELSLSAFAVRSPKAKSHADETLTASLFASVDEGGAAVAIAADEARLSTTTDGAGRLRRAGLEVFVGEDDPGRRAAGAVICGTSLDLGHARLDCAFVAWRMDGRTGVGRYDVLHRAPGVAAGGRG